MTDITPEKVVAAVCEADFGWIESLQAALSVTATGNVLSLDVARWDGANDAEVVRPFRAVVVEGTETPIVLVRPDVNDTTHTWGPRFGESKTDAAPAGWSAFAANHVVFGGSGHISFAEARRFAAALVAIADAAEAAQAEQSGGTR